MSILDKFSPERFGLITGSKVSVLFPKKSAEVGQRTYAKELASAMYFKFFEDKHTWQTEHGSHFESEAYIYYREFYDKTAVHAPEFEARDFIGGSADCICESNGVDFKCPTSLDKWLDYLHVGIDEQQYHQAQMYMHLYGRNEWIIAAYLIETHKMLELGVAYPLPPEKRMILNTIVKEDGWDKKLEERVPNIIAQRAFFYEKLVKQFGEK